MNKSTRYSREVRERAVPLVFLLLPLLGSVAHGQDHSRQFIEQLVAKHAYALSPSGRFLLISTQHETRASRTEQLLLHPVVKSGVGLPFVVPSPNLQHVRWLWRADHDELIGTAGNRWYTARLGPRPPYLTLADWHDISLPADLTNVEIRRLPSPAHNLIIVSALTTGAPPQRARQWFVWQDHRTW